MSRKSKNSFIIFLFLILLVAILFYFLTGFYIIPPGALSKGATHWFIRAGTGYPFISSPASILRKTKDLSSMKSNFKKVLNFPQDKIIATFKYSKWLYSFTER